MYYASSAYHVVHPPIIPQDNNTDYFILNLFTVHDYKILMIYLIHFLFTHKRIT
jgi:hypothetical protein